MEIGWTEETCSHMDALALEDNSSERVRYESSWRINFNGQSSNTASPRQRADFKEVIAKVREAKKKAVAAGQVLNSHIPVEHRNRQR